MDIQGFVESQSIWDEFAEMSDGAWFWHTTRGIDWAEEIGSATFVRNCSFAIRQGRRIVATCPVIVENGPEWRRFGFFGWPIPAPALQNELEAGERRRVWQVYVETLEEIAERENVHYAAVWASPLSRSHLASPGLGLTSLARHGFFDVSAMTQIVNLRQPEEALWKAVRKGHKADIRTAEKLCTVKVWDRGNITPPKFRDYQFLHQKDAGRITRSQRSFDLMLSWIERGYACLVEAVASDAPIAFALLILYKDGAYYGSACRDPDRTAIPASHLVHWEAIRWLKGCGYHWYDLGLQHFGPQWVGVPSAKDFTIARFKRGFGGDTVRLLTSEYFYSREALQVTFQRRLKSYLGARFGESWKANRE